MGPTTNTRDDPKFESRTRESPTISVNKYGRYLVTGSEMESWKYFWLAYIPFSNRIDQESRKSSLIFFKNTKVPWKRQQQLPLQFTSERIRFGGGSVLSLLLITRSVVEIFWLLDDIAGNPGNSIHLLHPLDGPTKSLIHRMKRTTQNGTVPTSFVLLWLATETSDGYHWSIAQKYCLIDNAI